MSTYNRQSHPVPKLALGMIFDHAVAHHFDASQHLFLIIWSSVLIAYHRRPKLRHDTLDRPKHLKSELLPRNKLHPMQRRHVSHPPITCRLGLFWAILRLRVGAQKPPSNFSYNIISAIGSVGVVALLHGLPPPSRLSFGLDQFQTIGLQQKKSVDLAFFFIL